MIRGCNGAETLKGVESTDAAQEAQGMMDTTRQVDGWFSVSEFAWSWLDLRFMQMSPSGATRQTLQSSGTKNMNPESGN